MVDYAKLLFSKNFKFNKLILYFIWLSFYFYNESVNLLKCDFLEIYILGFYLRRYDTCLFGLLNNKWKFNFVLNWFHRSIDHGKRNDCFNKAGESGYTNKGSIFLKADIVCQTEGLFGKKITYKESAS